jgi:hypothetical protein
MKIPSDEKIELIENLKMDIEGLQAIVARRIQVETDLVKKAMESGDQSSLLILEGLLKYEDTTNALNDNLKYWRRSLDLLQDPKFDRLSRDEVVDFLYS